MKDIANVIILKMHHIEWGVLNFIDFNVYTLIHGIKLR